MPLPRILPTTRGTRHLVTHLRVNLPASVPDRDEIELRCVHSYERLARTYRDDPQLLLQAGARQDLALYSREFGVDLASLDVPPGKPRGKALFIKPGFAVAERQFQHLYGKSLDVVCVDSALLPQYDLPLEPWAKTVGVVPGALEALPFPDNTFAYVIARPSLKGIIDPLRALDEAIRVAAPQGTVLAYFLSAECARGLFNFRHEELITRLDAYRAEHGAVYREFTPLVDPRKGVGLRAVKLCDFPLPPLA